MTGYDSLLIRKCIFADVFISRHHCVICTHLSITCSLTVINSIYPDQFDFVLKKWVEFWGGSHFLFLNWNTKNKIWINNDSIIFVMGAKCCHFIPYYWIYYQWRVYICLGSWSLNCYGAPFEYRIYILIKQYFPKECPKPIGFCTINIECKHIVEAKHSYIKTQ